MTELPSFHSELFLPDAKDNKQLNREGAVLCSRVISDNVPALKSDFTGTMGPMQHDHMSEAKQKSTVAS